MLSRLPTLSLALLLSGLATTVACEGWNEVSTGAFGEVEFIPDNCHRASCSFDDAIATGGALTVRLEPIHDDVVEDELVLISPDLELFDVRRLDSSFGSEWRLEAYGAGPTELIAIDREGFELDVLPIDIGFAERVDLEVQSGRVDGPHPGTDGADELYFVRTGERVRLEATVRGRDGRSLMGQVFYDVVIDLSLNDAIQAGISPASGTLDFVAPAGEHDVELTAPGGATLRARFVGE